MSVRPLLIRGMLTGLAAGLLAFVVAKVLGESAVGHAIGFESARAAAEHQHEDPAVFSRTVQSTIGLLTGTTVFGIAIGGLYSLGFAVAQGRLGRLGARATAGLVALAGFAGVFLLPFLKYPANPPSIGNPDTIGHRTALYLLMILLSLVVVIGVVVLALQLQPLLGIWDGNAVAVAAGVVLIAVTYVVMPGVHETPEGFPADVLWHFRLAAVAIQVTIWATLGLLFGALTDRALRTRTGRRPERIPTHVG